MDAWPNPFNPSTTVAWSLPSAGSLRLDVYDPAGRHLRTLREGPALAGPGSLLWDRRDEAGRPLPSGVYLLQLRGDEGDALRSRAATERGLFQKTYIDRLLARPREHITPLRGSKLWQLGLLEWWLQTHVG